MPFTQQIKSRILYAAIIVGIIFGIVFFSSLSKSFETEGANITVNFTLISIDQLGGYLILIASVIFFISVIPIWKGKREVSKAKCVVKRGTWKWYGCKKN
jgi:formate hydrogenlyase subunit 3/multisubunit Na+/H+ antiporter MnhD subunit